MSLSSSSSERFTTATSFLEHCSTDQILNYTVPTDSIIQETAPVPILNQPVDHALSSCTYFPPTTTSSSSSTGGFILSRILEDGFTLELRWSKFFKDTSERDGDGDERFRELEQHPGTLAPVRFTFPSRLIPDPCFNIIYQQEEEEEEGEGEEVLQVLTVSEAGYLYSLNFPLDTLFYSLPEQGRQGDWSEEFKVEGLENKLPVLLKGVPQQSGRVVIACKDGTNLVVELAQDGGLIELELKSPSSSLFSFKSLVPSFSRRDLSSTSTSTSTPSSSFPSSSTELVSSNSFSDSNSSPSQLISLAISSSSFTNESSGSSSFGFGVSRDKKLKIWNLDSGNCLRSIDLPKPTSSSTSQQQQIISSTSTSDSPAQPQQQKSSQLLLPSTPQTFLKITPSSTSSSDDDEEELIYESYLTIYSPGQAGGGSFFIYGLVTDSTNSSQSTSNGSGGISQLTPIAERTLPSGEISGGVIDFEISKIRLGRQGGQEGKGKWNLWVLDQISGVGEARIRVCGLSELDDIDGYDDDYMDDDWKEVSTGGGGGGGKNSTVEWNSSYFDQQIQSSFPQLSISEIFLKHISIPGRYPGSSFDYALTIYEEMILNNNTNDQNEELVRLTLEQEYESDLIRAAAVVGCQFELEYSQQTGAALKEDYNKKLKLEWLKFVSLLNESRKEALYPIKLELDQPRGLVFVIGRDSLSVPVKEELVISLHRQLLSSSTSSSNSLQELVPLFPQYPQSNFVQLLSLIKSVVSKLSLEELNKFESILFDRLRKPFTTDLEDVALSIFEESLLSLEEEEGFLDQVLQGLKSFIEPSKTIESFCQLLISTSTSDTTTSSSSSSSSTRTSTSTSTTTDVSNSLLSDLINSSIQARYDLSKSLVLLLIVAWGATAAANDNGNNDVQEPPIADFEQTSSIAFTTLNSISNLEWIKNQIVNPTYEAVQHLKSSTIEHHDDEFEDKFERLRMREEEGGGGAEVLPVPIYSLLNSLLRLPIYSPPCISHTLLPDSLYSASSSFLSLLGLLPKTPKLLIESTDSKQIEFLWILQKLGLNQQVLELLSSSAVNDGQGGGGGGLFPQSIGTCYVKGKAELELGNEELARKWFEKCACGLYYFPDTDDQDQGGLESILLSTTRHGRGGGRDKINSLSKFYIHLVSLFVPTSFDYSIARFSQLALDALDEEGVEEQDEVVEKDLWMKLFTSFAKMGQFEKAYQVIMETPHHETKTTCLAHFISLVCENGASSLLTSLSFVGFENDLERNLSFRARNSDPLIQIHHQTSTSTSSSPDYYKILYSYHVSKGDFKSAATVMYQQARRIGELSNTRTSQISFRDLVTAQCQSYLAATNALSLVEKEQAWVAIVLGGRDDGELRVQNKRRKIHYYIPEDEYDPTSSRPLELKELVDIRKEYQIALARLQLSNEFPELERTNFHLEPEAVVSLFTQTNCFDQAFQIATSLKVDLSSVFETLAEKCVSLTIHHPQDVGIVEQDSSWVTSSIETSTWSGSLSSKAWKLLNLYLKRHDLSPNYFYHSVVLERVLATTNINHDGDVARKKLPEFLMDFWIEKEQPQTLLRSLIKFDKLDQAFKYSLQTIKNSKISNSNFSTNLPYSIFDQLLEIPPGDSTRNLSDDVLKQLQQELRNALEERKNKLENIGNSLRR